VDTLFQALVQRILLRSENHYITDDSFSNEMESGSTETLLKLEMLLTELQSNLKIQGIHTTKILIGEMKMKQKFFAIATIAVLAIVGVFVFQYATSAQRPDRNDQSQRGNRQGSERSGRGMRGMQSMMMMMNLVSTVENSWTDLTFGVKVDDETLLKARPIYQEAHNKVIAQKKEVEASDDMDAAMKERQPMLIKVGNEFQASLKEILTEEQFANLNQLRKDREAQQQQRMNRFRGEGNRRGGGR